MKYDEPRFYKRFKLLNNLVILQPTSDIQRKILIYMYVS